jgi:Fic family protein
MDRLIEMHQRHDASDVPAEVEAAWLHRFAQTHPYQDGNGRVARSLSSALFVNAACCMLNAYP